MVTYMVDYCYSAAVPNFILATGPFKKIIKFKDP